MNKFTNAIANWTVNARWILFGVFMVLTVALFFVPQAGVNYDMTKYLPDDSSTRVSIELMQDEFGAAGTANVMVTSVDASKLGELKSAIEGVEGVASVSFNQTTDFKPETVEDGVTKQSAALFKVFFKESDYTDTTSKALDGIRSAIADGDFGAVSMNGGAVEAANSKNAIKGELAIILIIIIVVVLGILTLTSRSFLEPLVYLIVIGCAILLNMHTNAIMGDISYITQSISAIMLIALEMDYCIVLFSRFREERKTCDDPVEAMKRALSGSMLAVVASACTVMAGLLALLCMDYKIGADVGLVLAKGVFISIIAVLFLMPAVILMLNKLLDKTRHRSFLPRMDGVAKFAVRSKYIIPIIFTCVIAVGMVLQHGVNFTFTADPSKEGSKAYIENQNIETNFGKQNSLVVLVPNTNIEEERSVFNQIKAITIKVDGENKSYITQESAMGLTDNAFKKLSRGEFYYLINNKLPTEEGPELFSIGAITGVYAQILGIESTAVTDADKVYLIRTVNYIRQAIESGAITLTEQQRAAFDSSQQLKQLDAVYSSLRGAEYDRMLFNIELDADDEKAETIITEVRKILTDSAFKNDFYIVNATDNLIETREVFAKDKLVTDIVIVVLILLIVLLAFGSLSIPLLLVLTIQGAIWINLAISAVGGESVYFICYLLAMAIQMGATIDYGILLTERYVRFRKDHTKLCAITRAMNTSLPTILSSGLILILSAFIIHFISSLPLLSEIGLLIGRGALISVISILFVLPQLLVLFDKVIEKTTFRKLKFRSEGDPAFADGTQAGEVIEADAQPVGDKELSSRERLQVSARRTMSRSTEKESLARKSAAEKPKTGTSKNPARRRVSVKISDDTEDI